MTDDDQTQKPLRGVRVADFSRVFAGPMCTMLLGDLGADVVKIEHPDGGDDARAFRPPEIGGLSAAFVSLNRNKRSVALDLRTKRGLHCARELIAASDVLVENFGTGVMARYGLDHASLSATLPGLVYCSISAYGRTGPFAQRAGYDQVCQAESGLMSLTGYPDREPVRTGVPMVDISAGLFAFGAISSALAGRARSGRGCLVEVPLFDTAVCLTSHFGINYLMSGRDPQRVGNGSVGSEPVGVFRASDGSFYLTIAGERTWRKLVDMLGSPSWADDPRFTDNGARMRHRDELHRLLDEAFSRHECVPLIERMREAGVPAGQVRSIAQAFASPEVRLRGLTGTLRHPGVGLLPNVHAPLLFDGRSTSDGAAPPLLGEHTDEVVRDWLGKEALAQFRAAADDTP